MSTVLTMRCKGEISVLEKKKKNARKKKSVRRKKQLTPTPQHDLHSRLSCGAGGVHGARTLS